MKHSGITNLIWIIREVHWHLQWDFYDLCIINLCLVNQVQKKKWTFVIGETNSTTLICKVKSSSAPLSLVILWSIPQEYKGPKEYGFLSTWCMKHQISSREASWICFSSYNCSPTLVIQIYKCLPDSRTNVTRTWVWVSEKGAAPRVGLLALRELEFLDMDSNLDRCGDSVCKLNTS